MYVSHCVYAQHPYLVSLLFTPSLYSLILIHRIFLFTCIPLAHATYSQWDLNQVTLMECATS